MTELLQLNLLSPLALAFALGITAKLIRSELTIPREFYTGMSIYLLLALGLKGGVELSRTTISAIALPAAVTVLLGVITPVTSYLVLRKAGRFSVADSAAIAAHYGSVSAVTFIAAQQFVGSAGTPAEGFMPTLLTLLESPGIHIALAIGALQTARTAMLRPVAVATGSASVVLGESVNLPSETHWKETLREVLTARTMVLLVGGLIVGYCMGEHGWDSVKLFFDGAFKGILTLFLLEMGLLAGERLGDLKKVGWFLLLFGTVMPVLHGGLAVLLGHWAGLSVGGCTVLAAMAASASYIAAPPAVRMNLPEANPSYYLTLALAITFPFNLLVGIPLYYELARRIS